MTKPTSKKQTKNNELVVGTIAGTFGIKGELKCDPSNAGRALFVKGAQFHARLSDGRIEEVRVLSVRTHKQRFLLQFEGIESANAAERFSGAALLAEGGRIPLGPTEFLDRDLVGCEVFDASGRQLGAVTAVEHFPASDMLVVNGGMIPLIDEFIKNVDVAHGRIDVDVPPGLFAD